ncbi:hypothetical protein CNEO4_930033 [Clostridium neonatale]|nr:hypothetical protein CNEO_1230018 [Clostridium neonatale]CAI3551576.1 hypothetical protein CNEO4_1000007 [Clostridium neonatale]CAI3726959.1 hypothetical protein CNEO4_930033 [Clostridium neonatale]CAI4142623.1 hypothetical protein CNEO4_980007 [Clostridium neonatale]
MVIIVKYRYVITFILMLKGGCTKNKMLKNNT